MRASNSVEFLEIADRFRLFDGKAGLRISGEEVAQGGGEDGGVALDCRGGSEERTSFASDVAGEGVVSRPTGGLGLRAGAETSCTTPVAFMRIVRRWFSLSW